MYKMQYRKRNSLYPIRATSFVSIVMYLTCTIRVLLKKPNGMPFNPTITLKLIYISPIECAFIKGNYIYVPIKPDMFCLLL